MQIKSLLSIALLFLASITSVKAKTVIVDPNQNTQSQVDQAAPGDTILLAPGSHNKILLENIHSTECNPLVLMSQNPSNPATIAEANLNSGSSLYINLSSYIIVENINVQGSLYGIRVAESQHIIVRECEVSYTGQEGTKTHERSRHVDWINNKVHHTGTRPNFSGYGEAFYIGTGSYNNSRFDSHDTCTYIWIENNEIYEAGNGEAIEFKGGTRHSTARGNYIHDIAPGASYQSNEAALVMGHTFDNRPSENWAEFNTIEDVDWGLGGEAGRHAVGGSGICAFGGGHYVHHNTVNNCVEYCLYFNGYGDDQSPVYSFVYSWGNTVSNGGYADVRYGVNQLMELDPGFTNPNEPQSWCGDVQKSCGIPNLGTDQSLCGVGTVSLDAGLTVDGVTTFEWYKDGVSQGNPSTSATTFSVSQAGSWSVVVDSLGECTNSSSVSIADEITPFDLGSDIDLCSEVSADLVAGDFNAVYDYYWSRNGSDLGIGINTVTVNEPGTYEAVVSATGCSALSDQIVVSSSLPGVSSDTLCEPGTAELRATGSGTIYWYDQLEDGFVMHTGTVYEPAISINSTYYVQSGETSVKYTAGREVMDNLWDGGSYNDRKLKIVVDQELSIDSVTVSAKDGQTVHFRVLASDNSTILHDVTNVVNAGVIEIPVGITLPAGTYFIDAVGSTGTLKYENESANPVVDHAAYGVPGVISFDAEPDWEATSNKRWRYFYSWKISVGSACARVASHAVIDPLHPDCVVSSVEEASQIVGAIYPNPTTGKARCEVAPPYAVMDSHGQLLEIRSDLNLEQYSAGVYLVRLSDGSVQKLIRN